MTAEIIQLFKEEKVEALSTEELREFKRVLQASVDNFHQSSVMEKYSLYAETCNLVYILLDLLHPELKEEE